MKRILVPVSFSDASANSLRHAKSIFDDAQLTLLHTYANKTYSRKFHFEGMSYREGIRKELWSFYQKQVENPGDNTKIIAMPGAVSQEVKKISASFDLMVMSRKRHPTKSKGQFSDKKLFITTMARCPVLIMPSTDTLFHFEQCEHIWHIKRRKTEKRIVENGIKKLNIDAAKMEVKTLEQKNFLSAFWQNLVAYEQSHDVSLIKKIDEAHDKEPIDLIVLVDNEKSVFTDFFHSDIIHLFHKYDIPILVFPPAFLY